MGMRPSRVGRRSPESVPRETHTALFCTTMVKSNGDVDPVGFDYGTKFIGVAVGSTLTRTARPLATLAGGP